VAAGPTRGNLGSLTVAIGANTEGLLSVTADLRRVATAVRSLSTRVSNNTKKIENSFGKAARATKRLSSETDKAAKSTKRQEAALIKEAKAIQSAETKTLNLVAAIRRAGGSREDIRKLTSSTRTFRDEIRAARGDTGRFSNAQLRLAKTTNTARRRLTNFNSTLRKKNIQEAARSTARFRDKMQDLSKSVSLALGPLSGVASRITAFSGLANRNTIAIAGMIGAIIGLGFVIKKAVQAGAVFEVQFRRIEAQLELTGRAAEFSAREVNKIAEEVADATLTNAKTARQAASALLFFGRVSKAQFKTVLNLAQSLSAVIGGDLVQSAKRIGRALQDPGEGLTSLNRQLTLLSPRQEQIAKGLALMGKEAEATAFIIEKLGEKLGGLGVKEAAGVAGSFDTLVERIGRFLEIAGEAGGILQPFTDSLGRISEKVKDLNEELRRSPERLSGIGKVIEGVAKAFEAFAFNLDIIAVVLAGAAFGKIVKVFVKLRIAIIAATTAMATFNVVSGLLLNPLFLLAAAVGAVAIKMKFFGDEMDKTADKLTTAQLTAKIKGLKDRLLELTTVQDGLNKMRERMRRGTDVDAAVAARGISAREADIKSIEEQIKQLERLETKRAAGILGGEAGVVPIEKVKEAGKQLGDVELKLIELRNQLALLDPSVSKTEREMVTLGKTIAKVKVTTEDGATTFELMGDKLEGIAEGIQAAEKQFELLFKGLTRGNELAAESSELLARSIGRIQKPDILISYQRELDNLAVAFANNQISFEKFIELSDALADAFRAAKVAQQEIIRGREIQENLERFRQTKEVIGETTDSYGRLNSAIVEYQEKLVILNDLFSRGHIDQEQFNKSLEKMDIQFARNREGVEQFANTVSSGFAQGILAGDKLEDILKRIGDRLAEAALQALIFRRIMASFGGTGAVFGAPLPFDDPSAGGAGTITPAGGGVPPTLVGLTNPTPTTTTNRGGGTTTVIQIDARESDPGVELRVQRAILISGQQNRSIIRNNNFENSRRF